MEKSFDKPRGQWMATDGRELYHKWVVDMIDRREQNREDYDNLDLYYGVGWDPVYHNLATFSKHYTSYMFGEDEAYRFETIFPLMAASDELKHYTSVDDFLGESSNWNKGIVLHTMDGLRFASRVSLGLALDAYESVHPNICDTGEVYQGVADVLHDESFQHALESVATTAFAVLQNRTQRIMFQYSMPIEFRSLLGIDSVNTGNHVIDGIKGEDGETQYKLNPHVVRALHEFMHSQNTDRVTQGIGSYAVRQRIEHDRSSTTGCPVRRAPAGEGYPRHAPSAIALWADYMGSELERVVVPKFK